MNTHQDTENIKQEVLNINIQAVQDALRMMNTKIEEQQTRINGLISTVSTMQGELTGLNQRFAIQQAKSFGSGATVR